VSDASDQAEPKKANSSGLRVRTASAVVLAVPVLADVYLGPPWFTLLVIVVAALMGWEWAGMCKRRGRWMVLGSVYIAIPTAAMIWLRGDDIPGMTTIIWLFLVVWGADTGAYLSGRAIGGPKLAPRISPKKTWAGFVGGISIASLISVAFHFYTPGEILNLAVIGFLVALASQLGDLLESMAKRHFDVKDSSNLIPGHGGVLDRVDGLVIGAVALAMILLIFGQGVLPWY
jgi:phosphatidate cytidylyltransferase